MEKKTLVNTYKWDVAFVLYVQRVEFVQSIQHLTMNVRVCLQTGTQVQQDHEGSEELRHPTASRLTLALLPLSLLSAQ